MISRFFQIQMDYIFFFYGLCFVLLGAATWTLNWSEDRQMPWKWLCLFGLAHGIDEWLDMLVFSLKDHPVFSVIRLVLLVLSFLFLVEFGRLGSKGFGEKAIGRWVVIPLLFFAGLGAFAGMPGLNVSVRYALGLTGAFWTASALWRFRQEAHPGSRSLLIAALSMGFYGLATGLMVPQAPFFPASLLNLKFPKNTSCRHPH